MATSSASASERSDLLQGTLDVLVLKTLSPGAMHGWGIAHRIQQARGILACLTVVPTEAPESEPVRAFIAIGSDNTPNDYMPLHTVMSDEDLRRRALRAALDDLNRLKHRYSELQELKAVWQALEEVSLEKAS